MRVGSVEIDWSSGITTTPSSARMSPTEPARSAAPLCLVHDQLEWMRASLEGLSFDGSTIMPHECARPDRRSTGKRSAAVLRATAARARGLGATEVHYWTFDGRAGSLVRVRLDREYLKRLLDAEDAFWQLVRENIWPEPAGGELDLSADPKWRHVASRYREAKAQLEGAAAEQHKLRAMLESMATARRTFGCGVELLRSSRKGAADYAAIAELRGVNLEPYRKPPVSIVRINFLEPGLP